MRRARRAVPTTQDQRIAQRLNAVEADPPGWRAGASSDSGPLRIVRGSITTNTPTIIAGTGFTVARTGVGQVTITWSTPFPTGFPPSVVATPDTLGVSWRFCNINTSVPLNTTTVPIGIVNNATTGVEGTFHFIAIGLAAAP